MSSRNVAGADRLGPELLEKGEKGKPDKEGKGRWAETSSLIEPGGPRGKKGGVKPAEGPHDRGRRSRAGRGEGLGSDRATEGRGARETGPGQKG